MNSKKTIASSSSLSQKHSKNPKSPNTNMDKGSLENSSQKRKADTAFPSSSTSSHPNPPANKKRALKLSRQATRPHADIVLSAKDIWNTLRMHDNQPQQVASLMTKLMNLLGGKFAQVASKHDASRVIQAALQFADTSQRTYIIQELCAPADIVMDEKQQQEDTTSTSKTASSSSLHKNSTSYLVSLACSQYSHFIVLKMIKLCVQEPENIKTIVKVCWCIMYPFIFSFYSQSFTFFYFILFVGIYDIKAFKGSVLKVALHSVGARVMEVLFLTFPAKSTSILKLEFYGPQSTLFHRGEYSSGISPSHSMTLSSILQKQKDEQMGDWMNQQQGIVKFFHERVIQKGHEKKLYSFSFYQQLLWEYISYVPIKMDIRILATNLCDHTLALLSTRAGAKVVAECIAYGTPKERKRIIKSLKGFVRSTALHSDAYVVILRLLESTDDTVLIQKSILGELIVSSSKDTLTTKKQKIAAATRLDEDEEPQQDAGDDHDDEKLQSQHMKEESNQEIASESTSPLLELALSDSGCKVLLLILAKTDEERERYLDPWNIEILHSNPCVMEDGKSVPTSKKNKETRRMELLEYMKSALIQLCEQHAGVLLPSKFGSRVIRAVYETWSTETMADAIVAACDEPLTDSKVTNIFEHPFGHLVIKNLLLNEIEVNKTRLEDRKKSPVKDEHILASKLYRKFKGQLRKVIASSNRDAFVLAALASVPDMLGKEVRNELKKNEKEISIIIKSSTLFAGYEALLKAVSPK